MKICLIGEKLGHSFSKIIHEKMGYSYDLVEVAKDDLENFVKSKKYDCYNVTIPYKQQIMPMLDVIDESAKLIGSVNTVVTKNDKLYGYNTDIYGMEYAFDKANIKIKNQKVLILGSGGTYATAVALCKKHGAEKIIQISRNGINNYNNISKHYDATIIINTTPVGMYPKNEDTLINLKEFKNLKGYFDAIYNPLNTNMLQAAKNIFKGDNHCSNGLRMLVAQAKYARDIFFDNVIGNDCIERIISEIEQDKKNYVLIGMPSCGKSTLGALLAEALNKKFVDTDNVIENNTKLKIPTIFKRFGEEYFRDLETKAIWQVAKEQSFVIATGGGSILKEENIKALKQNGTLIFIDRDVDKLISDGRPLSKDKQAIQQLYNDRIKLYNKYADIIVDGNGSVSEVFSNIINQIK